MGGRGGGAVSGKERGPCPCSGICSTICTELLQQECIDKLPQACGSTSFLARSLCFTADSPGSYLTGKQ